MVLYFVQLSVNKIWRTHSYTRILISNFEIIAISWLRNDQEEGIENNRLILVFASLKVLSEIRMILYFF